MWGWYSDLVSLSFNITDPITCQLTNTFGQDGLHLAPLIRKLHYFIKKTSNKHLWSCVDYSCLKKIRQSENIKLISLDLYQQQKTSLGLMCTCCCIHQIWHQFNRTSLCKRREWGSSRLHRTLDLANCHWLLSNKKDSLNKQLIQIVVNINVSHPKINLEST